MTYKKSAAFLKDIQKVLKKHGLTAFSGPSEKLYETTKHLDGKYLFFTKGEKSLSLSGGENIAYPYSVTFKMKRSRLTENKTENDGN